MTKIKIRWTATFETEIEVNDPNDYREAIGVASDISLDGIEDTKYQTDTWEVEGFFMADDEMNEHELYY